MFFMCEGRKNCLPACMCKLMQVVITVREHNCLRVGLESRARPHWPLQGEMCVSELILFSKMLKLQIHIHTWVVVINLLQYYLENLIIMGLWYTYLHVFVFCERLQNCFLFYKHYSSTEALKTVHVPPDGKWNLKFPQELVENKTREKQWKSYINSSSGQKCSSFYYWVYQKVSLN